MTKDIPATAMPLNASNVAREEFKHDPALYQVNNIRFGFSTIGKKK
jgi:hypothetical protein